MPNHQCEQPVAAEQLIKGHSLSCLAAHVATRRIQPSIDFIGCLSVLKQGPPIEDDEEDYDEEEQPLSEDIDDDEEEAAGPSAAAGQRGGEPPCSAPAVASMHLWPLPSC